MSSHKKAKSDKKTPEHKLKKENTIKKRHFKRPKNNFGEGFGVGGLIALFTELYFNRYIPFIPVYLLAQVFILSAYVTFTILALVLTFVSAKRKKSIFGTWMDGFIIGAASVFDVLVITIQVFHGKFPFSMSFIWV